MLQLLALWPLPSSLQGLGGHCERNATSRANTAHGGDMAEVTGSGEAAGELQVVREEDVPDGHGFSCEKTSGGSVKSDARRANQTPARKSRFSSENKAKDFRKKRVSIHSFKAKKAKTIFFLIDHLGDI